MKIVITPGRDSWIKLTRVKPGMHHHFVPLGEGFLAILARVWPGVRVDTFMFSQQVPTLEVLGTIRALERSFVCMRASIVQL